MEKIPHHFLSVYSCKRRTNSEVDDNENKENVPDTKSDDEDIADLDCSEDLEEEFSLCAGCNEMQFERSHRFQVNSCSKFHRFQ